MRVTWRSEDWRQHKRYYLLQKVWQPNWLKHAIRPGHIGTSCLIVNGTISCKASQRSFARSLLFRTVVAVYAKRRLTVADLSA
jgi:hypothetical protein